MARQQELRQRNWRFEPWGFDRQYRAAEALQNPFGRVPHHEPGNAGSRNRAGNAGIPVELWGLVSGGAFLAWGPADVLSRLAWRHHARGDVAR